jgi:hypothetical protein
VSYALTKGNADVIGIFGSVDAAKRGVTVVEEWRADEHRPMGWNGWLPGAVPFSPPDYQITFIGIQDGFVWTGGEGRHRRRAVQPAVAQLEQCT